MSRSWRAAVIGCGVIGMTAEADDFRPKPASHAGAFRASARTTLAGLADTDPRRIEEAGRLFPGVAVFRDADAMIEACRPDIVSVAAPIDEHRALVELCASRSVRAVICEKPIARAEADAVAMIEACRRGGSLLFINHGRHFDPLLGETARRIRSGEIGAIQHVTCCYSAGLYNSATHMVDMLHDLIGSAFTWARALTEDRFEAPAGDLNVNGLLGVERGPVVTLQAMDSRSYSIFDARLYGTSGAVTIERFGYRTRWQRAVASPDFSGFRELGALDGAGEGAARSFFPGLVDHVAGCLEGRASPCSTGEDGLAVLRVLHALERSARNGGERVDIAAHRDGTG